MLGKILANRILAGLAVVAGLAGVVALAVAVGHWWVVLVGALTTLLWVVVPPSLRWVGELSVRYRNYPSLLKTSARLQSEIEVLKEDLSKGRDVIRQVQEDGIREGRERIIGAILSRRCTDLPVLASVGSVDGDLVLSATIHTAAPITVGTRFSVVVLGSGEVRGHVQVTDVTVVEDHVVVLMKCVDDVAPGYWKHLAERAEYDNAPPSGVVLVGYEVPEIDMSLLFSGENRVQDLEESQ